MSTCIFIDKNLGGGGWFAVALIRVLWIAGAFACGLALLSVASVLFGMKCYHLHEEYLASLRK